MPQHPDPVCVPVGHPEEREALEQPQKYPLALAARSDRGRSNGAPLLGCADIAACRRPDALHDLPNQYADHPCALSAVLSPGAKSSMIRFPPARSYFRPFVFFPWGADDRPAGLGVRGDHDGRSPGFSAPHGFWSPRRT